MSESNFRKILSKKMPEFYFTHIENKISVGVPDTHYLIKNCSFSGWIELKYSEKKPKKIKIRPSQCIWLQRYRKEGGICFVAVKIGRKNIYLWDGSFAKSLKNGENIYDLPHHVFSIYDNGWQNFANYIIGVHNELVQ